MIGRTNIIFGSGSSSGGSGGVTTVDLPTCPSSLTASPGNSKVTLTLAYSDTDFVSGVEVRYKTGSYPTSPTDGNGVTIEGAETAVEISGLTNGTTYYFRVYLYREIDGVKYYQTDETNAKIEGVPTGNVSVSGITPAKVGDDYLIIDTSGTFTLTVPEGRSATVYLVGGGCKGQTLTSTSYAGGNGGYGGYVYSFSLSAVDSASCTCSVGNTSITYNAPSNTSLDISGTTYNASSGTYKPGGAGSAGSSNAGSGTTGQYVCGQYLGSSGGGGGYSNPVKGSTYYGASGGVGAGDGGYISSTGSCNGASASHYGCGGGGGAYVREDNSGFTTGSGGAGKKGCIIITWI